MKWAYLGKYAICPLFVHFLMEIRSKSYRKFAVESQYPLAEQIDRNIINLKKHEKKHYSTCILCCHFLGSSLTHLGMGAMRLLFLYLYQIRYPIEIIHALPFTSPRWAKKVTPCTSTMPWTSPSTSIPWTRTASAPWSTPPSFLLPRRVSRCPATSLTPSSSRSFVAVSTSRER